MTTSPSDTPVDRRGLAAPDDDRSNCGVGVIVDLDGGASHGYVSQALELLANLEHRGTTGAEPETGDGAGIMIERPDRFFRAQVDADLPAEYAVGTVFMPKEPTVRKQLGEIVDDTLAEYGIEVLTWRDVPTDNAELGRTAYESEPDIRQVFCVPESHGSPYTTDQSSEDSNQTTNSDRVSPETIEEFDRSLYVARKAIESRAADVDGSRRFHIPSLDRQRVVYKGLLKGTQLPKYYPDLTDDRLESGVVLVHARFSTNTLGAWHLAHPYRNIVHNGEFNTIQGNINWMRARETDLEHEWLGDHLDTIRPIIDDPDQSDTASVDNALELLLQGGRELPHALRMLVPEAFRKDQQMDEDRRAFYDFHASLVEPWDGPALVVGFDGDRVAGVLDRNGLRPCRYDVTTDNRLIMASEAGALETHPAEIETRGRLQPGQLFVADPSAGRVVPDDEVFDEIVDKNYSDWLDQEQRSLEAIVDQQPKLDSDQSEESNATEVDDTVNTRTDQFESLRSYQTAFGYTTDQLDHLIEPMATDGKDPVGSMGDDTPLSVLSSFDRPLFTYFKQLFAQVSNPPIDYIREELVTSLESRLGFQRNLLSESPAHARQLVCETPVLGNDQTTAIKQLGDDPADQFESAVIDATFPPHEDLESAIDRVRSEARSAVDAGADLLVLSDRETGPERLPIPSLLGTGAVHHDLVRTGLRNHAGLIVESADPREVHHLATLVGYGAGAVNPYLAYDSIADIVAGPDGADKETAIRAYRTALEDGLLKTMAKMGISTVESYQGAQIFEAVGLDGALVDEYFEGTEIRTEGIDLSRIELDVRKRHAVGFGSDPELETHGEYENRSAGMHHSWNPETVGTLQQAVRSGDYEGYLEFSELVTGDADDPRTLRGLLAFDSDRPPVPIDEVEPITDIVARFSTAAMSLGSLSPEAHENNSIAMNRLGAKSNTGEGGEPQERFDTEKECNVKQVASGRFGVTSRYLQSADELQIKMAQGSKPGEGGHLPGRKVNEMIAHVRHATPGVGLISPPPQHDIYSIEDLKQLIHDLKAANPEADINVKLVSEAGIGTIAAGVAKANADTVHISGHSGGTGASPKTSIKNAGLPWELGLTETTQMLRATGLRDRITVSTDGGLQTGRDVAVAALLGAEEYVFGTASLVTSGCVMARQCHENTCPVGVATQREELRKRFPGKPEHVINYMTFIAQELREIMADLGFRRLEEMIGRPSLLQQVETDHPRAKQLDLSSIVAEQSGDKRIKTRPQEHDDIDEQLDWELIDAASDAIDGGDPVSINSPISNVDRAVGATLSNRISAAHGVAGLPPETISVSFDGIAGQSFGAFLAPGVDFELEGAVNDYLGKGLSGGRIVIRTPDDAAYDPAENVVVGNVALYGATAGECYVNGVAGERFGVRNSGTKAVVEGLGDHGCEYMTGGVVVVLGETGRNFAAGMSGGVAYVYDPENELERMANTGMVSLSRSLESKDEQMIRRLVENHQTLTDSDRASTMLEAWPDVIDDFVRVFPETYATVIDEEGRADVRHDLPAPVDGEARAEFESGTASDDVSTAQ